MILVVDYNLRDIRFQVFKKRHKKLCTPLFIKYPEEIREDKDLKKCISDIVGKNKADPSSMIESIRLAAHLSK